MLTVLVIVVLTVIAFGVVLWVHWPQRMTGIAAVTEDSAELDRLIEDVGATSNRRYRPGERGGGGDGSGYGGLG
jgi:hypothetical protein